MKDDSEFFGEIIISKKSKLTGDEQPHKKGGKKNKKNDKTLQPQAIKKQQHKQMKRDNFQMKQRERILNDLCLILTQHDPKTIEKVLIKQNYNKQNAMQKILQMEADADKQQDYKKKNFKKSSKKQKQQSPQINISQNYQKISAGNELLNQVYDAEQINGQQFEQLFQQIAQMIKEQQKQKGLGMFEINSFVDQCNQIKDMFIIGFQQQLNNIEDFELNQSNPLFKQTQIFIQKINHRQIARSQLQDQNFPTLGSSSKSNQKNILQKIQQENKKKKFQNQQLFVKSNHTSSHYIQKSNQSSIFNVDNKLRTQKDMMILHKEFYALPINDLKFIYKTLATDINLTRQFLIEYYDEKRSPKQYTINNVVTSYYNKPVSRKNYSKMKYQQIDRQIVNLSYDQLRKQLDHLFKMKQVLQMTRAKIKNQNQRIQLERMINQKIPLIKKMIAASRVLLVKQMSVKDPHYVDLHSYRQEQIFPLLDCIMDMIRSQSSNPKIKIKNTRGNGQGTVCLTVMTGKGLHSRGQRSILKPLVIDWSESKGFEFDEEEDHIKVYITV